MHGQHQVCSLSSGLKAYAKRHCAFLPCILSTSGVLFLAFQGAMRVRGSNFAHIAIIFDQHGHWCD